MRAVIDVQAAQRWEAAAGQHLAECTQTRIAHPRIGVEAESLKARECGKGGEDRRSERANAHVAHLIRADVKNLPGWVAWWQRDDSERG